MNESDDPNSADPHATAHDPRSQQRVWVFHHGASRAASAYRTVAAQPNWVVRAALIAFLIVVGVPFFLLLLFATFVAVVILAIGLLIHRVMSLFRGESSDNAGRENVRVIRRVE